MTVVLYARDLNKERRVDDCTDIAVLIERLRQGVALTPNEGVRLAAYVTDLQLWANDAANHLLGASRARPNLNTVRRLLAALDERVCEQTERQQGDTP